MQEADTDTKIEVVRGQLDDKRADQLLRFWSDQGALEGQAAQDRLSEVVRLLLNREDEIAGVNSVYADDVEQIGGRRFWVYRSFFLPGMAAAGPEMVRAAFDSLETEFKGELDEPLGLCLLISDKAEMQRRPEAEWSDPRLLYAGYLPDGRQVRIAYFEGAKIGPGV